MNVELRGIEPRSKHGSHTLSTCLVLLDFRDLSAAEQPNMPLVSVFFNRQIETLIRLAPDCVRLLVGLDQGMTARETSRPGTCAGIKLKLLCSLKQRERN
jgi:hypothetical protein